MRVCLHTALVSAIFVHWHLWQAKPKMPVCTVQANGPSNPSCGYGPLSMDSFPFGKVASISASSPLLQGLPQSGCGACFQLTCEAGVLLIINS